MLVLPPEEQYLVVTGRTHFRGMVFDDLERLALDLETTGLDARNDRIFLVALCRSNGASEVLEAEGEGDQAEAALLVKLAARVREIDPDVIENHHLHGFDLPFIVERARRLGVPLELGRAPGLGQRPASRGAAPWVNGERTLSRRRYTLPGRELIDTLDAVRRHDFSARDLPGHGLKAVARHFGIASEDREYVPGSEVYRVYRSDPERVRRYARGDVDGGVAARAAARRRRLCPRADGASTLRAARGRGRGDGRDRSAARARLSARGRRPARPPRG